MDLPFGTTIDRYVIEGELGRGGMAEVYLARHAQLGSLHALKVLTAPGRGVRERLVAEGRAQSGLKHPNLVTVTDLVTFESSPVLVMEYVRGPSLAVFLENHRPTIMEADRLARSILRGMAEAHRCNLVHRDLKPNNILLAMEDGAIVPKIADFGLVKLLGGGSASGLSTRTGALMGTPAYMAPEQLKDSSKVDARADVFALGAILYEIVTGNRAFDALDTVRLLDQICAGEFRPIREIATDIPERMERAIVGALEVDPEARIPDVASLLNVWATDASGWVNLPSAEEDPWSPESMATAEKYASRSGPATISLKERAETDPGHGGSAAPTFDPGANTFHSLDEQPEPQPSVTLSPTDESGHTTHPTEPGPRKQWGAILGIIAMVVLVALAGEFAMRYTSQSGDPVRVHLQQAATDPASDARLQEALDAMYTGEFALAERLYDNVVEQHPDDPIGHLALGLNHCMQDQKSPCLTAIEKSIQRANEKTGPEADLVRVVEFSIQHMTEPERVMERWETYMDEYPDLFLAHVCRIATVNDGVSLDQMMEWVATATDLRPDAVVLYAFKGSFTDYNGDTEAALRILHDAIERFPTAAFLKVTAAVVYGRAERYAEGRAMLEEVIKRDPYYGHVRQMLVTTVLHQGDEKRRLELLESIQSSSTKPEEQIAFAMQHAGFLYGFGRMKEGDAMVEYCAKIAESIDDPQSAPACFNQAAIAHILADQPVRVAAWLDRFKMGHQKLEIAPGVRSQFMSASILLDALYALQVDELDTAATLCARLEKLDPEAYGFGSKSAILAACKSALFSVRGDVEAALESISGPMDKTAKCITLSRYGSLYYRNGRYAEFEKAHELLVSQSCDRDTPVRIKKAEFMVFMASIRLQDDKPDEAKKYMDDFHAFWRRPDPDLPLVLQAVQVDQQINEMLDGR